MNSMQGSIDQRPLFDSSSLGIFLGINPDKSLLGVRSGVGGSEVWRGWE